MTYPSSQGATGQRCVACCRSGHGKLYRIVCDLFFLPETVDQLATLVLDLEHTSGEPSAAEFRDRSGLSRKRSIQMLEFLNRVGYTRRVHEAHRLRNPDMFGSVAQRV
jgi:selenocysteine-specific elongation factor